MSNLNLRLPDYLHNHVRDLAKREGMSINRFITLAVAEKVSVLDAESYLIERARRANKKDFARIIDNVPDLAAEKEDAIPEDLEGFFK